LIVALNVVDKVALDPLGCLLPPGLDLISGTYRNSLMETCPAQTLLDGLLQYALQRRMLPLCREAAFAIQDNWEKTRLLERRGKAFHLIVPVLQSVPLRSLSRTARVAKKCVFPAPYSACTQYP